MLLLGCGRSLSLTSSFIPGRKVAKTFHAEVATSGRSTGVIEVHFPLFFRSSAIYVPKGVLAMQAR
jgi:hypothetical protein